MNSLHHNHQKYVSFLIDIDQKVLSAKIRLSKMVHTGFVAEVQGGEKRLVNRGDFFEEFSIRPVRTGMSRTMRYLQMK